MPKAPSGLRPILLLAVDFSPASWKALEMARSLAADLGAKVRLVHALAAPARKAGAAGRQVAQAEYGDIAALSAEWAGHLRDAGLDVEVATPRGPAAQAILGEAAASRAGFLALGTEGATGLRRLLVGSVAQEVLRGSPIPVLVAPARLRPKPGRRRKGASPIVVALDLNDDAHPALDAAAALAEDLAAPLRILYTVALPFIGAAPLDAGTAYTADLVLRDEEEAAIELTRLAEPLRQRGLKVTTAVRVGEPATALLADADHAGASLLVVGTHSRSGVRKLFLGSVAQKVVRTADRPVLVVPVAPAGRRKAAARAPKRAA